MNHIAHLDKIIELVTLGTPYKTESEQSQRNSKSVIEEIQKRFPTFAGDAKPYINILTFGQWKARGYRVKKGEHSIRIPIMTEIEETEGQTKVKRRVRRTACLFALPQVEKAA